LAVTPIPALLMAETTDCREPSPTETLSAVIEPALSPPEIPTATVPPDPELSTTDVVPDPAMSDTVVDVPSTLTTPSVPRTADPADRPRAERADPPVTCRDDEDPCWAVAIESGPDAAAEALRLPPDACSTAWANWLGV
jgi:hypothetical protein